MHLSVIIPVYNSSKYLFRTIREVLNEIKRLDLNLKSELILVDDGSNDGSWSIISSEATKNKNIKAIRLLKNYGQHYALFCGLSESEGEYCITIDDDLQNPPAEIKKLLNHSKVNNCDFVVGNFIKSEKSFIRLVGSKIIGFAVNRIYSNKKNITNSNFRLLRRDLVDRIITHTNGFPYINGLALENSINPDNILVAHEKRVHGSSKYSFPKLVNLSFSILFNYSVKPLRLAALIGIFCSSASFLIGMFFLLSKFFLSSIIISGWTSIVVLLAFFSGINLLILGLIGEYIVNVLLTVRNKEQYIVHESINVKNK
jgi:glycosyltransferase involved in cell wall biosynthesis